MMRDAESASQRLSEQPRSRGRTNQREGLEPDGDDLGMHAAVDGEVDLEILHRGIDVFLDGGRHAVDLIDEEDVTFRHSRERPDEVTRLRKRRSTRGVEPRTHLRRNDMCERRLAQSRRTVQKHVLHRVLALTDGFKRDRKSFNEIGLTDVLRHADRTKRRTTLMLNGGGLAIFRLLLRSDDSVSCHDPIIGSRWNSTTETVDQTGFFQEELLNVELGRVVRTQAPEDVRFDQTGADASRMLSKCRVDHLERPFSVDSR